jgi:hypothetical protein
MDFMTRSICICVAVTEETRIIPRRMDTEGKWETNPINVEQIVKLDFKEEVTPTFRM